MNAKANIVLRERILDPCSLKTNSTLFFLQSSVRYRYSIRMDTTPLAGWENFYVIVGSSAGALIGLQFVVITLIADLPIGRGAEQAGEAFATPTIVHFGTVLLLSAILNAPWHGIHGAAICWGIAGTAGIVYAAIINGRVRRQTAYQPEFEDWLFHLLLPIQAYSMLAGSAIATIWNLRAALFVVAAASLLLLFAGIHNAWDAVTYHVFVQKRKLQERERERNAAGNLGVRDSDKQ
jgi:hypothetical protein